MMAQTEPLFGSSPTAPSAEAQVAEVELPGLKIGQKVAVTPAGAKDALAGTIRLIAPEVDQASRSAGCVALDGDPPVAIGTFARGVIETGRKKAVTLPLSAITYGRGGASVQAVKDGKVVTKPVTLGLAGGGRGRDRDRSH